MRKNKILQSIKKINTFNVLRFLLDLNMYLYPLFYVSLISLIILESVIYPGFVGKHFVFSIEKMLVVFSISCLLSITTIMENNLMNTNIGMIYRFVHTASLLSIIPTIIVITITSSLKNPNVDSIVIGKGLLFYPNHVVLVLMLMLYYITIFFVISKLQIYKRNHVYKILNWQSRISMITTGRILYTIFIFVVLISSLINIYPFIKQNTGFYVKRLFLNYDGKMRFQIGPVYDYYNFVVNNTRPDSYILKPTQQGRWPDISNEGFSRYFLYPRKFVSEEDLMLKKELVDYVFLLGGVKLHRDEKMDKWPNFDVPAKRIILYSKDSMDVYKILNQDYNYEDFEYDEYWGVIEVDKNKIW